MAIKSKEELLEDIKKTTGDDTSDETLGLIEDITDTLNDYDEKVHDQTDWKQKYEDNDKEWRNKYKERFFSTDGTDTVPKDTELIDTDDTEEKKPKTFLDLFTFKK